MAHSLVRLITPEKCDDDIYKIKENKLDYSVFSSSCIEALQLPSNSANTKLRGDSIQELQQEMHELRDVSPLLKPESNFMPLLLSLTKDQHFKVASGSMYVLSSLVTKAGSRISPFLQPLTALLMEKAGDTKALTRQIAFHILSMLMRSIPPQVILNFCLLQKEHENPRVREELCNIIIMALLAFKNVDFEYGMLAQMLWGMLSNNKAKVKYVVVESLAVIAYRTSPAQLLEYLAPLKPDSALLQLLVLRLQDSTLPQLNLDGTIEHIISQSARATPRPLSPNRKTPAMVPTPPLSTTNSNKSTSLSVNTSRPLSPKLQQSLSPMLQSNSENSDYQEAPCRTHTKSVPASPTRRTRLPWEKRVISGTQSPNRQFSSPPIIASQNNLPSGTRQSIDFATPKGSQDFSDKIQTVSPEPIKLPGLNGKQSELQIESDSQVVPRDESAITARRTFKKLGISEPASPRSRRKALLKAEGASGTTLNTHSSTTVYKTNSLELPEIEQAQVANSNHGQASLGKARVFGNQKAKIASAESVPKAVNLGKDMNLEKKIQVLLDSRKTKTEWNDTADLAVQMNGALEAADKVDSSFSINTVHEIAGFLAEQLTNLRTTVSRVAVHTTRLFFERFGKLADTEVDALGRILLKKMGESKGFLVDETDKALDEMVASVSATRSLAVVLQMTSHKSSVVRGKCAQLLRKLFSADNNGTGAVLCEKLSLSPPDFEKLCPVLIQLLRDGSANTRYCSRHALLYIYDNLEKTYFNKQIEKSLPASQLSEVFEAIEWARSNQDVSSVSGSSSAYPSSRSSKLSSPKRLLKKADTSGNNGDEGLDVEKLIQDLSAGMWTIRNEAITRIAEQVQTNPSYYAHDVQRLNKWFEVYMDRLRDGNVKVQMHALQSLASILPAIAENLETIPAALFPALAPNLSSANTALRQASSDIIDVLINILQQSNKNTGRVRTLMNAVESLSSLILYNANTRIRPMLLEKLTDLVDVSYQVKPALISKHFVSVAVKMIGESKIDVKNANLNFINEMQRVIGPSLFDITNPLTQDSGQVLSQFVKQNV